MELSRELFMFRINATSYSQAFTQARPELPGRNTYRVIVHVSDLEEPYTAAAEMFRTGDSRLDSMTDVCITKVKDGHFLVFGVRRRSDGLD